MNRAPDDGADALRRYHEVTKHSYQSVRTGPRGLDWANAPRKFKDYVGVEAVPLPAPTTTGVAAHEAIRRSHRPSTGGKLDLEALSSLAFFAAGVHAVKNRSWGDQAIRTYAAAGALYPDELYVVTGELPGLPAGVYHYGPLEHALVPVRTGDLRGTLVAAAGGYPALAAAPATLVFTGIPWRTVWKYRTRGWRHLFWDAGMMLANLLAACAARDLPAEVVVDFVDAEVNHLLAVDGRQEFALTLVPVGDGAAAPPAEAVPAIRPDVVPLSPEEIADREIEGAQTASSRRAAGDIRRVRPIPAGGEGSTSSLPVTEVAAAASGRLSVDSLEKVILRRGSTRRLAREPMPAAELVALLDGALGRFPADAGPGPLSALVIANAVEGLPPGAYRYLPPGVFVPVRRGEQRDSAAYLCLEQPLGGDAAAVVFVMARLDDYLGALGGRGYRVAQLEAAVGGGRMYLGAYAQCLGCSGITFYDDEVAALFGSDGWSPMLAVVVGPEGARRSIRACRVERERRLTGAAGPE
ncbi:MAG: SagB/ThcOx family dehydrogenase [Actinomycetota bacterium]